MLNEEVKLDEVIKDKCAEYAEMAESMALTITLNLQSTTLLFHQHLVDILISNLLGNAIRYNAKGGSIDITLDHRILTIANTSNNPELDNNKVFKRFYREHYSQDGNGLGLSIVKQVCDLASYPVSYVYKNGKHIFTISFGPANTDFIQN